MSDTAERLKQSDPRENLLAAARLVEDTAFEIALSQSSKRVSELIVIAADLERLALLIGSKQD